MAFIKNIVKYHNNPRDYMAKKEMNNMVVVVGGPEHGKQYVLPDKVDACYVKNGIKDEKKPNGSLRLAEYIVRTPPWGTPRAAVFSRFVTGDEAEELIANQSRTAAP